MTDAHEFCRALLRTVRTDAKAQGVAIPKGLTALSSDIGTREQWFIEAKENSPQVYVKGDCAFEARANYISSLLRDKEQTK
jgi:hypothetical protein